MKLIITGGAGFIGSAVVRKALAVDTPANCAAGGKIPVCAATGRFGIDAPLDVVPPAAR